MNESVSRNISRQQIKKGQTFLLNGKTFKTVSHGLSCWTCVNVANGEEAYFTSDEIRDYIANPTQAMGTSAGPERRHYAAAQRWLENNFGPTGWQTPQLDGLAALLAEAEAEGVK